MHGMCDIVNVRVCVCVLEGIGGPAWVGRTVLMFGDLETLVGAASMFKQGTRLSRSL